VPGELLSIGRFARSCRLSIKALRHYDEIGLLSPAHVDVATGYRRYRREQAPAAIAIALLRSLDVPLPAIRTLLAADDPSAVLERERARRARDVARAETALRTIERLLRAGTVFPYEIGVRDEPAMTVVAVEAVSAPEDHVEAGTALAARLRAHASNGPFVCIVHPTDDDRVRLEMCAPVDDGRELAGGPMAVARHVGPYAEIGLAEYALRAWAEAHDVDAVGPIREVYLNDPAIVAPDALETDVLLPISRLRAGTPRSVAARR
jgi:DNA-binding transcriptional MerR regulator